MKEPSQQQCCTRRDGDAAISRLIEIAHNDIGRTDADSFRVGRAIGGSGDWCAYWLSSVLERSGSPAPAANARARRGARALVRWVGEHGQWVIAPRQAAALVRHNRRDKWHKTALQLLQPGDIIAWRASRNPLDWRGHVALIVAIDRQRGFITTIGGNERGAVRRARVSDRRWPWRRRGGLYGVSQINTVSV